MQLGHSDPATTARHYADLAPGATRETPTILERCISEASAERNANSMRTEALWLLTSCTSNRPHIASDRPQTAFQEITVTGTVRHFEIEGGFFTIQGDDGITYDPVQRSPYGGAGRMNINYILMRYNNVKRRSRIT